jgi:S-adenosyl-L-methionine hydrolase (adenosine-forming)
MSRVTLLTDFGTRDGYVGAVKAVIATVFPGVRIDDVSHALAPGDVSGAALALGRYWDRYPSGTVHLAVVDPGVGTGRRALAVEADRRLLVAPDNGVLSRVFEAAARFRVVEIVNPEYTLPDPSRTFHGRDVFAPVAAFLARGVHLSRFGPVVDDPVVIGEPDVEEEGDALVGRVVSQDRFGNLVTNLPGGSLETASGVEVEGRSIPVVRTYAEGESRQVVALVNSDGRLEVAARGSSAAKILNAGVGTLVRVRRLAGGNSEPGIVMA